ncbi:MAG: hypothetical protein LBE75_01825 [Burkholderiales bacterium]|jgi:hypothetical protein|nr:hypothetical protein [Burkholderiales bacterium]
MGLRETRTPTSWEIANPGGSGTRTVVTDPTGVRTPTPFEVASGATRGGGRETGGTSSYIIPPATFPTGLGVAGAGTINASRANHSREWTLQSIAALGKTVPLVYGEDIVAAKYYDAIAYQNTMYLIVLWALGPCIGVQAVEDSNGKALTGVTMRHYDGSQTAVDARLKTAYEAVYGGSFTYTFPRRCYSVFEIASTADVDPGTWTAVVRGMRLYDPRDPSQSIADPSTWKWSINAALALANFLSNKTYGWGKTLDWESVQEAADYCDEMVGTSPNQFKRWTVNWAIIDRQAVGQLIETLRSYAHCNVVMSNGIVKLIPDRPGDVAYKFDNTTEKGLVSNPQLTRRGVDKSPTVMRIVYTDKTNKPWRDRDAYAYMPGTKEGITRWSESTVYMQGIDTYQEALRTATERLLKLQHGNLEITADIRDIGLVLEAGDIVDIPHPVFPGGKPFRLTANPTPISLGKYRINGVEYQPEVYSDDVTLPPTFPDTTLPDPSHPPPVEDLSVVERLTQIGGVWTSALFITWTRPEWAYRLEFVVEFSQGGTVLDMTTVPIESYISAPVIEGEEYIIRVRSKIRTFLSAWETVSITAQGKYLPPSDVERFTEVLDINGTVHLAWTPAHDIDAITYEVRRIVDPGIDLNTATPEDLCALWDAADVMASPVDTRAALPLQPPAAYIYSVKAKDSVGNYSINPRAVALVVQLDDDARFVDTFAMAIVQTTNATAWEVLADPDTRWTSDRGESINFGHIDADPTTGTLEDLSGVVAALPHDTGTSELVSQLYDVGTVVGGTWTATASTADHDGNATLTIELSNNTTDWEQFHGTSNSATASRPARFARLRITSAGSYTLTGKPVLSLAAIPRVETGEILVGSTGIYTARTTGRYKGFLGNNPIDLEYLGTENYTPERDSIIINADGTVRFDVYLRDQYGERITGRVKWTFRGV